jgi:uncharacterized protein YjbK
VRSLAEHIEIEYKNLLTEQEYQKLLQEFNISPTQIKKQVNYYFDTAAFFLKDAQSALRMRKKDENYELTLKSPAPIGLLETNQLIGSIEAQELLEQGKLPDGPVKSKLMSMEFPLDLIEYFGSLTTNRVEFDYEHGLLVLDYSTYLNKEDYEIEYEVTNPEIGKQIFIQLLKQMNIPIRKTENKILRFYRSKYQQ